MFRLYLITDETAPPSELLRVCELALAAGPPGAIAIQLRRKRDTAAQQLVLARALRALTARHQAKLLVNDRADVAKLCGADGVHLPQGGLDAAPVRDLLGPHALVGRSTHSPAELAQAVAERASFVVYGPIHATPGKGPPLGMESLSVLTRTNAMPMYALGGISEANAREARDAGCAGVAVIRAVFANEDPARAVRAILEPWSTAT